VYNVSNAGSVRALDEQLLGCGEPPRSPRRLSTRGDPRAGSVCALDEQFVGCGEPPRCPTGGDVVLSWRVAGDAGQAALAARGDAAPRSPGDTAWNFGRAEGTAAGCFRHSPVIAKRGRVKCVAGCQKSVPGAPHFVRLVFYFNVLFVKTKIN